jgi:phosphoribosyl 1,2-cyclic phosphodiesterase
MLIRFWGTRGSLPVALTADDVEARVVKALLAAQGQRFPDAATAREWLCREQSFATHGTYGGASSCVQFEADCIGPDEYLVCDAGSGMRGLGHHVLKRQGGRPATVHLLMSHPHWDHIMGFPFFTPVYIPGNRIIIYGGHDNLEQAFRNQHSAPSFPVQFEQLGAQIEFVRLDPAIHHRIAGVDVQLLKQLHAGDSYGYRLEHAGRVAVYSTDSEHKPEDIAQTTCFTDFFRAADVVIFDAMYSLADAVSVKEDWGHSSNIVGVELCQMAGAKHLVMFHHEPMHGDDRIDAVLAETRRFEEITREDQAPLKVTAAYDGLELDLAAD